MSAPVLFRPAVFPTKLIEDFGVVNGRLHCVAFHTFSNLLLLECIALWTKRLLRSV
jgi:hypothetical protein